MSVTVVKDKGVTVVTVASDSKSVLPPLCQILKALCYSPTCCSVSEGLIQKDVTAALGTVQLMVGLFNIGLGPGRTSLHPGDFAHLGIAYWLGGMFIAAGLMSVLAGWFPSRRSLVFAVFLNIVVSVFAIIGIVLYAIDLGDATVDNLCDSSSYTPQNDEDNCRYVAYFFQRLLRGMDITMIILTVLQLCVCITFTVLGFKALMNRKKGEGGGDVEIYQPLLTDVLMTSPGA